MKKGFIYVYNSEYCIPKSGDFLVKLNDIDLSYYLKDRQDDEDMNDLLWDVCDNSTVYDVLKRIINFKDNFDNFYSNKINKIDITNIANPNNNIDVFYFKSFVILRDKNEENYILSTDMELTKIDYNKEVINNMNKTENYFDFNLDFSKENSLTSFNYKEELSGHNEKYLFRSFIEDGKTEAVNKIIRSIENSALKNKMDDFDELIIVTKKLNDNNFIRLFEVISTINNKNRYEYIPRFEPSYITYVPLNRQYALKMMPEHFKEIYNSKYNIKFNINLATANNLDIAKNYINIFKNKISVLFPSSYFRGGEYNLSLLFRSIYLLNNLKKEELDRILNNKREVLTIISNDELSIFKNNFITRKIIIPEIMSFYKLINKSNFDSIANKFIRIYYKENISDENHPGALLTNVICKYKYIPKIQKGKDIHKLYGITYNNITKLSLDIF